MSEDPPSPLFVLGKHRSGTTWLTSQLAGHSEIHVVSHPSDPGNTESKFFSHVEGRYGDLSRPSNFTEFAKVFGDSDFARRAGWSEEDFYDEYPASYENVFRAMMDEAASSAGSSYWLEKTPDHTPIAPRLHEAYEDARFVGILRSAKEVVASHLGWVKRSQDLPAWKVQVFRYADVLRLARKHFHYERVLHRMNDRSDRVHLVRFDDMRDDLEGVMEDLAEFLGLPFEASMLETFEPNSSFDSEDERRKALTPTEETLVPVARAACRLLPMFAHEKIRAWRRPEHRPFPDDYFMGASPLSAQPEACSPPREEAPADEA